MTRRRFVLPLLMVAVFASAAFAHGGETILLSGSYFFESDSALGIRHSIAAGAGYRSGDLLSIEATAVLGFKEAPSVISLDTQIHGAPDPLIYRALLIRRAFGDYGIIEYSFSGAAGVELKRVHLQLGYSYRFLEAERESGSHHLLYRLELFPILLQRYSLSYALYNFSPVFTGNISDMHHGIVNEITVLPDLDLIAELSISNPGQVAFSSYISGFALHVTVRYRL